MERDRRVSEPRHPYCPAPDGRRVAFPSDRSGVMEIWRANADGSDAVQLTRLGGPSAGPRRWSPDGRHIAFDAIRGTSVHIFVMNADGGEVRQLTMGAGRHFMPAWSHDGRSIYYGSNRSGTHQIWRIPVAVAKRCR